MLEENRVADAHAVGTERAAGCHEHRQIIFQNGCELRVNSITGAKTLEVPPRRRPEIMPNYPVMGLRVFRYDHHLSFEWYSEECIDEAMARDAQARAGWSDTGYGFYGLEVGITPEGSHRAKWSCGVSCE